MTRLRRAYTVGLAVAFSAIGLEAGADDETFMDRLNQGQPQTVVVYGTSLTAGGAWVSHLSTLLDARYPGQVTLFNAALSGRASNSGVANLSAQVLSKNPDAVFIEFAINDAFTAYAPGDIDQGITVELARSNLTHMINEVGAQNPAADIILQTMSYSWDAPNGNMSGSKRPMLHEYYQMYREVAAERGLALIDNAKVWSKVQANDGAEYSARISDGTHPDALGYQRYATPAVLLGIGANIGPCLIIDLETGAAILHNQSEEPAGLIGYTISSPQDALRTTWAGLAALKPDAWQKANPTRVNLSELSLDAGGLSLAAGESIPLGDAWDAAKSLNLRFQYQTFDGVLHDGYVVFLDDTTRFSALAGDYNGDGSTDAADYVVWRDHLGLEASGVFASGARDRSVLGPIGAADYSYWRAHFGNQSAASSHAAFAAVPEPTCCCLLTILVGSHRLLRRR